MLKPTTYLECSAMNPTTDMAKHSLSSGIRN